MAPFEACLVVDGDAESKPGCVCSQMLHSDMQHPGICNTFKSGISGGQLRGLHAKNLP